MELCVAMKYCITRYSLNETGVLKKFAPWLFHAKNITSLGIKPRAPMAHWAPGCIGCSLVPSGVFLLPPWAVNLCHMAGVRALPCTGNVFAVLQWEEETQRGCPRTWPGSFLAYCGCRLCGRWHRSYHCCNELCSVLWECLQGSGLQWLMLWVGHIGWGCQTYPVPLAFPVKTTHTGAALSASWLNVLAVLEHVPTVPRLFRHWTGLDVHKRGFDPRISPGFNINLAKLFCLCFYCYFLVLQTTEAKVSYCLCPPKHPIILLSSFFCTPLNLYLLFCTCPSPSNLPELPISLSPAPAQHCRSPSALWFSSTLR